MHPRNPYGNKPPDFLKLAQSYPPLEPHLVKTADGVTIDFKSITAQRCLTEAILRCDFGITLTIPEDRLCPPVPNRLNYVLWLQDIYRYAAAHDEQLFAREATILDVGTGASAIYPLLGCWAEPRWKFVATEIDSSSIECAAQNIQQNNLTNRICVLQVDPMGPLFPVRMPGSTKEEAAASLVFDFTMCNPPFYSSREEVMQSAEAKEFGPSAVCTGTDNEMITPGGEVAFVRKMVEESLRLKTRCLWYTSMLGKMSSLVEIVELLRHEKIDNYAVTEFVQGRTRRWAVAWSFTDIHLPDSCARFGNPALQHLMPPRNTLRQTYTQEQSQDALRIALRDVLAAVEGVTVRTHPSDPDSIILDAAGDTWSRAARRKRLKSSTMAVDAGPGAAAQMVCQISIPRTEGTSTASLEFQWVKGGDRGLFESFMSHVARKVGGAVGIS